MANWPENISSVCGLGRISRFPGTLSSLVSLVFSVACAYFFNETIYTILFLLFIVLGSLAISKLQTASKALQEDTAQKDHSWIVIDEWIGMWLVGFILFDIHSLVSYKIFVLIFGFIIFRLIDIFKIIPPIRAIDSQEIQTAHEIILDDVIAGIYSYAILMVIFRFYNVTYVYLTILFLLTPMIANMTPVLLQKMPFLGEPIHAKLFGKNKTWRGFIGGILAGTLFLPFLMKLKLFSSLLTTPKLILVCFLLSAGALTGDVVKSFFKRRQHIRSGKSWIPWDQIDYVLGAIAFTYFFYHYSFAQIILFIILGGAMSALAHRSAYLLKMISTKS